MSHLEAKSTKHLSIEVDQLTNQLERLTDEVVALRRDRRSDRDQLTLELAAIRDFLAEAHPDLQQRFHELREQIRLEVNPE